MRRASAAGALLFLLAAPAHAQRPIHCVRHLEKSQEVIRDWWSFAILKLGAFDLDAAVGALRGEAASATTADECADVLDRFVASLRDGHANLTHFPGRTPRSVPAGIELRRFKERLVRPGQARPAQRLHVVRVDSARPELAGIPVGSQVLEIDGRPADDVLAHVEARMSASTPWGLELWSDRAVLRGAAGTPVRLVILTPAGEIRDVELPRPEALPEAARRRQERRPEPPADLVQHRLLEGNLGYVRLTSFAHAEGVRRFDAALEALKDTDGLILDLRGNGGGLLGVLADVAGRFFADRSTTIMQVAIRYPRSENMSEREAVVAPRRRWTYEGPLVLLVDAGCFSACDLFANAMDEHGRALIIGATPTGGGTASPNNWAIIPEFDGVSVRASFMVATRTDGSHIEGRGIRPHVVVETSLQDYIAGRDPQLERAIGAIAAGEAPRIARR
jgi:carboxyl-terminal processing protease